MRQAFFVLLLILSVTAVQAGALPLTVGWEHWFPYQFRDSRGQLQGVDIAVTQAVAEKAGISLIFVEVPWQRLIRMLPEGGIAVAMGATRTQKREAFAYFSDSYRLEKVRVYSIRDVPGKQPVQPVRELQQLFDGDMLIGIEPGYYYGKTFSRMMENTTFRARLSAVATIEQNIRRAKRGYIDVFLGDRLAVMAVARRMGLAERLVEHPVLVVEEPLHLMLSKKVVSQAQVARINQALAQMRQSGQLAGILEKYSQLPEP